MSRTASLPAARLQLPTPSRQAQPGQFPQSLGVCLKHSPWFLRPLGSPSHMEPVWEMGGDLRKVKGKIFYIWDSGAHLGSRCALGRKHCPTREDQSLQAGLRPRKTQLSPTALQLPTAYLSACKRDSTRRGERRRARRRRRRRRKDLAPPPQLHGASPLLSAARLGWAGLTRVWSPLPGFSAVRWDPGCPWTIPCGLLWSGGASEARRPPACSSRGPSPSCWWT